MVTFGQPALQDSRLQPPALVDLGVDEEVGVEGALVLGDYLLLGLQVELLGLPFPFALAL